MTQAPAWIAVVLFAVLVGVAVPVLLQLKRTLTSTDRMLEVAERRLGVALAEVTDTLGHINRSAEEIEKVTKSLGGMVRTLERTGTGLQRVKSSLRRVTAIPAAVGPMLIAAIRGAMGWADADPYERHRLPVTKEIH